MPEIFIQKFCSLLFFFLNFSFISFFFKFYSAERLLSITPCAYPLLSDTTRCGIDDVNLRRSVRVCDPDKAISMSESKRINKILNFKLNKKFFLKKKNMREMKYVTSFFLHFLYTFYKNKKKTKLFN